MSLSDQDFRRPNGRFPKGYPGGPVFKALQEQMRRADHQAETVDLPKTVKTA